MYKRQSYDWRLFRQDIAGSIAHARAQLKAGLLSQEEFNAIESGLNDILKDIEAGNFSWSRELEDVHTVSYTHLETYRQGRTPKGQHGIFCSKEKDAVSSGE